MAQYKPRNEFTIALSQIATERGIPIEIILETINQAILVAYRRDAKERGWEVSEEDNIEVKINPDTGEAHIFKITDDKKEDVTPPGFSRIAAQTAKQVIIQKIREAEKGALIEEYSKKAGSLVTGMILRFDGPNVIIDIGKTEAVMMSQDQVRSENYHVGQRLTFYLEGIREGARGQQVALSRSSAELVRELFRREVPEVSSGAVLISAIAREPGVRTKIAVSSTRAGIDPVGSCVGQKGVRVNQVIEELFGEKIDIIQFSDDPVKFIAAALSPAEADKVEIDQKKKTAKVIVPEDQLSLAIGKEGGNVRLASILTGYKIDVVGEGKEKGESKADEGAGIGEEKEVRNGKGSKRVKAKKEETAEVEDQPTVVEEK